MRILILAGSYRKNGNTARVVHLIKGQLHALAARSDEPLDIETVHLAHQEIGLCRGCRVCFDQGEGKCPLKDDLLAIKRKMKEADGVILASPVYVTDVSGVVKNWIDRLAHVCHRPEFAGKCAYLVATVGDSSTGHALRTMSGALQTWGFHIVGQAGFKMGALMAPDEVKARYQPQAEKIAQRLFRAIVSRRFARPSFLSLLTFKVQQRYWQRYAQQSLDYDYWKDRGWVEPDREFYIPHEANRIKLAFARLAGALIAPFVT